MPNARGACARGMDASDAARNSWLLGMVLMADRIEADKSSTVTWALKGAAWAKKPYPADPSITKFEAWLSRVNAEARVTGKCTIMRNQASMGMSNNYWPCLSRLAIMASPALADYIHPNHLQPLDDAEGVEMLNRLYRDVVGRPPKLRDWKNASRVSCEIAAGEDDG